jgi:CubicO group peptidase (beta-lactamase class C family)
MSLETRIDELMRRHVRPDGPGAAIGVLRDGAWLHRSAYGMADLEWGVPLRADCVFRIASLTKQFTAMAVMMLEERGGLSVEDPLERWLPGWRPRGRRVTLRRLLDHTSGVWRHDSDQVERTQRPNPPLEELLDTICERDFEFEPGERYRYNNSGYLLLGAVIAAASQRPYEAFLQEAIFEPLGMKSTGLLTPERVTPRRVRGYVSGRSGFHNARADPTNWSQAAGGLGSTLDDLALWDRALREHRLVRADTFERMLAPTRLNDGSFFPYGFGWGLANYRGARVFHHTGGVSGFASHMLHFRDEPLTTIVLANLYLFPMDQVTRGLVKCANGWPESLELPRPVTAGELAPFAGRYENADGSIVVTDEPDQWAALPGERLCSAADPEVDFRFSEREGDGFARLDHASPLWPVTTFRRTG